MKTPICDFVEKYAQKDNLRLHMPGHKGVGSTVYKNDITEIPGADSLYEADGIISESEAYASELFGSHTFYSAEGSSLAIRAMLYLVSVYCRKENGRIRIAAARNAHKTFVSTVALIDLDVDWLVSSGDSYLTSGLTGDDVRRYLKNTDELPAAVYITSPDYLGNIADVKDIADACHEAGVLLLVDNAHGAYLKFLKKSLHPIDLGADMCCDSAHKTLPALTGGAYLHIARTAPETFRQRARSALALFGSTSPSYLILASLDSVNKYLSDGYSEALDTFTKKLEILKAELGEYGYGIVGNEPMKLTLAPKALGYTGSELGEHLAGLGIVAEFTDPDFTVLMPTPKTSDEDIERIKNALFSIEKRKKIDTHPPVITLPDRAMSIRDALMSAEEYLPVEASCGRVLASMLVGCPPAVPIAVSGEVINESIIECFKYYNIEKCAVVKPQK